MSRTSLAGYGRPGEPAYRRVVIDREGGTITFIRCHLPDRFLALGPEPEYTCRLEDVRGHCWNAVRGVGQVLEIVTPTGRARLPCSAAGFASVRAAVEEAVARTGQRLRWYEYPAGQFVVVLTAAVAGAAGGLGVWVCGVVPDWTLGAALAGAMSLLFVPPALAWWRGRALW